MGTHDTTLAFVLIVVGTVCGYALFRRYLDWRREARETLIGVDLSTLILVTLVAPAAALATGVLFGSVSLLIGA